MRIAELCASLEGMRSRGTAIEEMLEFAVRHLHGTNPRFHWTGVYELFPDQTLRLGPFVGAPTDHVFIGVGRGVCGTAVAEGRNMNIPDVREVDNYLACSTETRSELGLLIRTGDRIHAQIDIDSHQVGAFDETTVADVQRVADTLARAYDARVASEG